MNQINTWAHLNAQVKNVLNWIDIKVAPYIKESKLILRGPQCEKMVYEILNLYGLTQD